MLKNFRRLDSLVKNRLIEQEIAYPIKAMDYNKIYTSPTNTISSQVENFANRDIPKVLKENIKLRDKILVSVTSLSEKNYNLIKDKYFNGKTYESMANGQYGTYSWETIWSWVDKACEELLKGGILEGI